jgi:hypothetical protein
MVHYYYNFMKMKPGHKGYELEELRSFECWSLLTPKLLDSITHKLNVLVNILTIP